MVRMEGLVNLEDSIFNAKKLSDEDILKIISKIIEERNEIQKLLSTEDTIKNPKKLSKLSKRLNELNEICSHAEQLKNNLNNLKELEKILKEDLSEADRKEYTALYEDYLLSAKEIAKELYKELLNKGYLEQEKEDEIDIEILKFIDYAGPEYAWRLSININISWEEARERLKNLMDKGFLERVPGNMLENYHREKNWTKHMNHTYYRITRKGRLYLRELRQKQDEH